MLASTFPDQWILIRSRKVNDNDIRQQGPKRIVCNFLIKRLLLAQYYNVIYIGYWLMSVATKDLFTESSSCKSATAVSVAAEIFL